MRIPSKKSHERAGQVDHAAPAAPKKKNDATAGTASSAGSGASATAAVSVQARSLAAEHGIDSAKVEQLRELINTGAFKMDFMRIAERIVQTGG